MVPVTKSEFYRITPSSSVWEPFPDLGGAIQVLVRVSVGRLLISDRPGSDQYFAIDHGDNGATNSSEGAIVSLFSTDERLYMKADGSPATVEVWVVRG